MLQDVGLIFHPPLLYVGYVGFAVNFAMSLSALIYNQSARQIARSMRGWVLVFLVVFNHWYCAWCVVGILRTWLGRLVVLGSRRKCVFNALVAWFGVITQFNGDGKTRRI